MGAPRFIDLFSGAGLFSAGLIQAGLAPVLAIELAADAAASYRRNVGSDVVAGSVEDAIDTGPVDVICAGPPCQGFSTLGRRDPTDVRNDLSLSVLPWVRRTDPKLVVIENVPPFLRSHQWRMLAEALGDAGYAVETWELDALDHGTPQRRVRAFTVASRIGPVSRPAPAAARLTAAAAFATPVAPGDPMHTWPIKTGNAARRIAVVPRLGDKRDIVAKAPELCPPSWFRIGCQATDVYGRIDPDRPANTIRCEFQNPSKGRYLHPTDDRVISLREGARLQGVPEEWVFTGQPYPVARQIGNGVPVPLAAAVGRSIRAAL